MVKGTLICLSVGVLLGCGPSGTEPGVVNLPVVAVSDGLAPCTNNLGWQVTLTEARVAVRDIEFTIEGEFHTSLLRRSAYAFLRDLGDLILTPAFAHPGHQAGGEVTGQLLGTFVVDFFKGKALGNATLLEGDYHGINLGFRVASQSDVLHPSDPLVGHTAVLSGKAEKDGKGITFQAVLDIEDGLKMVGGLISLKTAGGAEEATFGVKSGTAATLGLTLFTIDPSEHDTLFDDLDFGAIDADNDGKVAIVPGEAAHNILAKTLMRHDHWGIVVH